MRFAHFNCVRLWVNNTPSGILLLILALSLACTPAPVGVGETKTPSGKTPPHTAFPMPPTSVAGGANNSQSFTLLDSRRATLSDYLGKVLVLDFWATYCQPCREAAPQLNGLQKRFGSHGFVVVGLNVGGPDDHPRIPEFIKSLGIEYALGIPEPEMTNFFLGSVDKIPQTLVFDRSGRIVKHFVGYDSTVSAELERTIQDTVTGDK